MDTPEATGEVAAGLLASLLRDVGVGVVVVGGGERKETEIFS